MCALKASLKDQERETQLFHIVQFVEEPLHPLVERCVDFCACLELKVNYRRMILFVFVSQLMFEAGPEIHGYGAQLDFNRHFLAAVQKKDRNGDNQMQTSVTGFFGIDYVIFFSISRTSF